MWQGGWVGSSLCGNCPLKSISQERIYIPYAREYSCDVTRNLESSRHWLVYNLSEQIKSCGRLDTSYTMFLSLHHLILLSNKLPPLRETSPQSHFTLLSGQLQLSNVIMQNAAPALLHCTARRWAPIHILECWTAEERELQEFWCWKWILLYASARLWSSGSPH